MNDKLYKIKLAAYYHWLKTGRDEMTCWLIAEKEVEHREKASSTLPPQNNKLKDYAAVQRHHHNKAVKQDFFYK